MAYRVAGNTDISDISAVKALCKSVKTDVLSALDTLEQKIDEKISDLDIAQIDILKNKLEAISAVCAGLVTQQTAQHERISILEATVANLEITTSEVLSLYEANNG